MLQELSPEVIGISETHLKNDMDINIVGYEWVGENNQEAIRGSRGVGLLIQTGIEYKIIRHNSVLIEQGRSIGIEIGNTQIHIVYMPVNTDPQDKINLHYEGISQLIQQSLRQQKELIIMGDLNSHINT